MVSMIKNGIKNFRTLRKGDILPVNSPQLVITRSQIKLLKFGTKPLVTTSLA